MREKSEVFGFFTPLIQKRKVYAQYIFKKELCSEKDSLCTVKEDLSSVYEGLCTVEEGLCTVKESLCIYCTEKAWFLHGKLLNLMEKLKCLLKTS